MYSLELIKNPIFFALMINSFYKLFSIKKYPLIKSRFSLVFISKFVIDLKISENCGKKETKINKLSRGF